MQKRDVTALICKRMVEFGWTSQTLSEFTGVSPATVKKARCGLANTNLSNLVKMFDVLGIGLREVPAKHCKQYGKRCSHERVKAADGRTVLLSKEYKGAYVHLPPKKGVEYEQLNRLQWATDSRRKR